MDFFQTSKIRMSSENPEKEKKICTAEEKFYKDIIFITELSALFCTLFATLKGYFGLLNKWVNIPYGFKNIRFVRAYTGWNTLKKQIRAQQIFNI